MQNEKRDLIDRGRITYTWFELSDGKFSDGITLQSVIHAMPTVDAVEVIHGHWVPECKNRLRCSHCGFGRNTEVQIGWNYCPNCGACMDGGNDNE